MILSSSFGSYPSIWTFIKTLLVKNMYLQSWFRKIKTGSSFPSWFLAHLPKDACLSLSVSKRLNFLLTTGLKRKKTCFELWLSTSSLTEGIWVKTSGNKLRSTFTKITQQRKFSGLQSNVDNTGIVTWIQDWRRDLGLRLKIWNYWKMFDRIKGSASGHQ